MGNCQEVRRTDNYDDDNTINTPEQKSKRERTQQESSMKFMSQTADDEQYQGDDFHKLLEMPKKMIRKPAPKFESNIYFEGVMKVNLEDYAGKYLVLFFYPFDFNKMFQEEILDFSDNTAKFKKLNCELLGCSIDSHFSHMNYCTKPRNEGGLGPINFPLMADVDRKIAGDYGVLVSNGTESGTCLRSTFIIDDKQVVRHLAINDFAGHLKAEEILRMVSAIQEGDKANQKSSAKSAGSSTGNNTLYDKIGGEEAITAAVGIFYKKMLADNRVAHFFKAIDMNKQHSQQISFLCFALGGPKKQQYVGKNMRDAHQYLRLTNLEFDVTVGHLVSTLKDLKVDEALIGEIGKLVEPLRKDIVFAQQASIFEQLGGEKAIETAVDIFYQKVLADDRLSPFFKSTDMSKQKVMMRSFLTMALGGSKDYSGKNMKEAHKNMNITDVQFDATVGHLKSTLKELKVDEKIMKQIDGFIEPLRKDIVSAKPPPPIIPVASTSPKREANKTDGTPTNKTSSSQKKTLIDRIGGIPKIEQLVGTLLDRVYKDKRINSFFATVESAKLKEVIKAFLVQYTGGEKGYKGKNLKDAHASLKVNDVQFNIFVNHLRETLISMKVEASVFQEFSNLFESFRGHIVTVRLSTYDRLGGDAAISNISAKFYTKASQDERIKDIYSSNDLEKLKELQSNFVQFATGGGKQFLIKNTTIKINDIQFNAFKDNLLLALKELLVDPYTYNEISGFIEAQRLTIVNVTLPLIDRLGGDKGILAIVNRFYDRVLLDQRVQKLFVGIDMKSLRHMNHQFILFCVKGSPAYTGKNMKDAHAKLALNDTHFNLIKDHLIQSMRDCSRDPLSLNEIGNVVEGLRNDIVSVKVPLFERIGGDAMMKKAVEKFYSKALQDPRIKDYFKNVDMNNLKISQNNFLTMLMGGPNNYKGKDMKQAHAHLKINEQTFTLFKDMIVITFRELGIDNITILEIAKVVEGNRNSIVSVRPQIYDRLGGEKQMDLIIPKFYDKLLKNPNIGQFFASIDQEKQKKMLKAFFTGVLGGQPIYKGKNLTSAHSHFKVTDAMFTEFRVCMETTLKELGINPQVIKDVSIVIEHFKKEIVR